MTVDVAAARQLADAATAGPWTAHTYRHEGMDGWGEISGGRILREDGKLLVTNHVHKAADAEFIAAARSLVPALLDDLVRVSGELANTQAELARDDERFSAGFEALRGLAQDVDITPVLRAFGAVASSEGATE